MCYRGVLTYLSSTAKSSVDTQCDCVFSVFSAAPCCGLSLSHLWMSFPTDLFFLWVTFHCWSQPSFYAVLRGSEGLHLVHCWLRFRVLRQMKCSHVLFVAVCLVADHVVSNWIFVFFSAESQQAACLERIKSPASVSLLILGSDVKANKRQRFMSEVNWQLFSVPPGLSVPGVYDDAALRLDPVRKHRIYVIQQSVRLTENILSPQQPLPPHYLPEERCRACSEWSKHFVLLLCPKQHSHTK